MQQSTNISSTFTAKNLGTRLRSKRDEAGLTRKIVHEKTGIPLSSIEKYENGSTDVPVSRLFDLANLYHVTMPWLLGEEAPENNNSDTYTLRKKENTHSEHTEGVSEAIFEDITESTHSEQPETVNVNVQDEKPELETIDDVLNAIDQMREREFEISSGDKTTMTNYQNKLVTKLEQAKDMMTIMEPDELTKLAIARKLYSEKPEIGFGLSAMLEDNSNGTNVAFKGDISERILDTVLLGCDLFLIERDDLAGLADELKEDHDIEEPAMLGLSWGNHEQLVPILRPILRGLATSGDGVDLADRKLFQLRKNQEI
ncbi:helix-turn-helix domain-containing protein [Terasakiella sp.]|uniref:helix-turn-helix domain-containing protein n=1 Tax=Terasakiella sp. TaxID=2034861 RepID=UPI003AA82568